MKSGPAEKSAVVSGLGPNGVAATLELLNRGFAVTAVEKRADYTRPIHLHLRPTYLQDIQRLSPQLHRKLLEIATPIEENSRMRGPEPNPVANEVHDRRTGSRKGSPCPVWSRLSAPPERHVRLDNAERLFYDHLVELARAPESRLTLYREVSLSLETTRTGRYRVQLQTSPDKVETVESPDLIVLAEGGKSHTVKQLELESVRFSYPKYFMSAHVPVPYGPRTRRIDLDVRQLVTDPGVPPAEVSLWASGHGDSNEGTWVVLEVPEALLHQQPQQAEEYFLCGALLLMDDLEESSENLRQTINSTVQASSLLSRKRGAEVPDLEAAANKTFAGTFKFEQQCLRYPAAGKNVVVLGDAAGMGHHALSSGLEMGALDLGPLGLLCDRLMLRPPPENCISEYAQAVFESRLRLLGMGMKEYYPDLGSGKLKMLQRAAELFGED